MDIMSAGTLSALGLALALFAAAVALRRRFGPPVAAAASLAAFGAIGVAWLALPGGQATAASTLDLADYEMTFEENFDQLSVSAWGPISMPGAPGKSRWIAHTPWNGDFGDAQFVDPTQDHPFVTENGILRIEARKTNGKWTSGLLASADAKGNGFLQKHGYFEIRTKLPKGPGVWPAFWLIANQRPEASAEIDVLEYYGQFTDSYQIATHVWPKTDAVKPMHDVKTIKVPANSLTDDFQTFGVSVESDFLIYYHNRQEVARVPTPEWHKEPMFILTNLALGSGWPIDKTPDPSHMLVDYIRAYSKKAK